MSWYPSWTPIDFTKNRWVSSDFRDEMAKIANQELDRHIPDLRSYCDMAERVRQGRGKPATDPNWYKNVQAMHQAMKEDRGKFENSLFK